MTKADKQLIAAVINDWKRQNKGTQGQLALKCGLRPNNFNEIVRGKRRTTILPVIRIANNLHSHIKFWQLVQILLPEVFVASADMFARKEKKCLF